MALAAAGHRESVVCEAETDTDWLISLNLLATALEQGRIYHSGTPAPWSEVDSDEATSIRGAFALRLELLGLKELLAAAELRWELLHMGVHPSGEGIGQVRNDARNLMMYRPEYHRGFCMHAFSVGACVLKALLREVELLDHTRSGGYEQTPSTPVMSKSGRHLRSLRTRCARHGPNRGHILRYFPDADGIVAVHDDCTPP